MIRKNYINQVSRIGIIKAADGCKKGSLNTFLFQSGKRWAGCQQILKLVSYCPICPNQWQHFFLFIPLPISLCSKEWQAFFSRNSIADQLLLRFVSIKPLFSWTFQCSNIPLVLRSEDLGFTQVWKTMVSHKPTVIWNWKI